MVEGAAFRLRSFGREVVSPRQFSSFMRDLGCVKYSPTARLKEALGHYGITKVYVDGSAARRIIDNQKSISAFCENRQIDTPLDPNLAGSFSHRDVIVVRYTENTVCFIACAGNRQKLTPPKPADLAVVIKEEAGRDFPSRKTTTLDTIERGGLWSGSDQDLMVELLLSHATMPQRGYRGQDTGD